MSASLRPTRRARVRSWTDRIGRLAAESARLAFRVAVLHLAVVAGVAAQTGPGTTSAVLLELAPGPRQLALGGASTPLAAEAFAVFYNPARLAGAGASAGAAYQSLPAEIGAGALAGALRLGPGTVAAGIQYLDLGSVEVLEPDPAFGGQRGRPTGEWVGGADVSAGIAYGVRILGALELGAAGRALRSRLAEAHAGGWAVDLGAALEIRDGRAVLAAVAQNLGPSFGPAREARLPRIMRAGAAAVVASSARARATVMAEGRFREDRADLALGLEAGMAAPGGWMFDGRVGYDAGAAARDGAGAFSFGAGISAGRISFDYAYRALGPLGAAHQAGIGLRSLR